MRPSLSIFPIIVIQISVMASLRVKSPFFQRCFTLRRALVFCRIEQSLACGGRAAFVSFASRTQTKEHPAVRDGRIAKDGGSRYS
jgi:hypothetical protein